MVQLTFNTHLLHGNQLLSSWKKVPFIHPLHHISTDLTKMEDHTLPHPSNGTMSELDMCKTALCFKEQELFALRADVQNQHAILQSLSHSIERMERTVSAGMDRLARTVNRLGGGRQEPVMNKYGGSNKRKRRENY